MRREHCFIIIVICLLLLLFVLEPREHKEVTASTYPRLRFIPLGTLCFLDSPCEIQTSTWKCLFPSIFYLGCLGEWSRIPPWYGLKASLVTWRYCSAPFTDVWKASPQRLVRLCAGVLSWVPQCRQNKLHVLPLLNHSIFLVQLYLNGAKSR